MTETVLKFVLGLSQIVAVVYCAHMALDFGQPLAWFGAGGSAMLAIGAWTCQPPKTVR